MPALGELAGVRPGAARHRLARRRREQTPVSAHQRAPLLVRPLLERLAVADRQAGRGTARRRSPARPRRSMSASRRNSLASHSSRPVSSTVARSMRTPSPSASRRWVSAWRSDARRLLVRRVAPEQRGQLFASVRAGLQRQERQQPERLRPKRRRDGNPVGRAQHHVATESENHRRRRLGPRGAANLRLDSRWPKGLSRSDSRWARILPRETTADPPPTEIIPCPTKRERDRPHRPDAASRRSR